MTTNSENMADSTWGKDITILCPSDFRYLPGVYALFNSAVLNGFLGKFEILVDKHHDFDLSVIPNHPQLAVRSFEGPGTDYYFTVSRLAGLRGLSPGKYLHLDADMIIERPCGHLFEPIENGIVVSSEPERKYDQYDVLLYDQAKEVGLSHNLKPFNYVNGGLFGFRIPEHNDFINQWAELSFKHFRNRKLMSPVNWFCLDQCMLNLLIRQPDAPDVFAISPRQLEFGSFGQYFQDRPFPYLLQGKLIPTDQTKFIIHGAGIDRPWLERTRTTLKGKIGNALDHLGLLGLFKKPKPYGRAWAYYALSENLPIPHTTWTNKHSFNKHNNPIWRSIYGL
ncbi:MAG: hypothetical protein K2Y22_13580 [Candidatus Obscuribacterales bacterium]|nr:hypothetical protein [Candidatus Obscuribacterales bacterium]